MGLQAIVEAIHAAGEVEVSQIQEHAAVKARELLANAMFEGDQAREDARAAASAPASRERARILHDARLEALHTVGDVREALVDEALDKVRQELQGMRLRADYPILLRSLVVESFYGLRSEGPGTLEDFSPGTNLEETILIEVDQRDRGAIETILGDAGWKPQVRYTLDCWGGIIARVGDDRIIAINTLESRLERAMPMLRRSLADYFENGQAETALDVIREGDRV